MLERKFFLYTERLGFSTWSKKDLPLARRLWSNPDVARFICARGVFSEEEIKARLSLEIESLKKCGAQYFPIFDLQSGSFAGCSGLHARGAGEFEIGFHLLPEFQGKGYATEAGKALISYAFAALGALSLFAGHNPKNVRSKRVLEKLGFVYTHDELYEPTGLLHPSYAFIMTDGGFYGIKGSD